MNRKWIGTALTLAIVLVLVVGCSGKKPPPVVDKMDTSGETMEAPATDVTPAPMPSTGNDPTPYEDMEISALNERITREGLLSDVYFDFDKYDLKQDARNALQKNATFISQNPRLVFGIEGHCDERGTNEYNLALGERRANSASGYLASLGAGSGRLRTISYGEERPTCMTHGESCWGQNRRAHFLVTGKTN